MDNRITDAAREPTDSIQETLSRFRAAHRERMVCLQDTNTDRVQAAIDEEREAMYRHADAVRRHSEELARIG